MGDASTTTLACRDCGTAIFRKPGNVRGRGPMYCGNCALIRRRRARSQHKKRRRAGVKSPRTFACIDCAAEFLRLNMAGSPPMRCEQCWTTKERARGRAKNRRVAEERRQAFETDGRWTTCETCGTEVRCRFQGGPKPRWCEPCRVERLNAKRRATKPWIRVGKCEDCGGPTDRASRTGEPRRRCPRCNAGRRDPRTGRYIPTQRQAPEGEAPYGPAWTRHRGQSPDHFSALEIFERDRWVCGICRKRIDPKLRAPHRMAATLDHLIPVIEGGIDSRANTRAAHQSCNSSRNHRGGGEQLLLVG